MANNRNAELVGKLTEHGLTETELEPKYRKSFDNSAAYLGNGVYGWGGIVSTDTRELWLLGLLAFEGIYSEEIEDDDED